MERFTETTQIEIARLEENLEKLKNAYRTANSMQDDYRSKNGMSKNEIIGELVKEIEKTKNAIKEIQERERKSKYGSVPESNREEKSNIDGGQKYVRIGELYTPICELPKDNPMWKAVPGAPKIEGGIIYFPVQLIKDTRYGTTQEVKPGGKIEFSPKHRVSRLDTLDIFLRGRKELIAFRNLIDELSKVTVEYHNLNPDDSDYGFRASDLATRISGFTDPSKIKNFLNEIPGLDIDDFCERAAALIETQQFLRSIDVSLNDFIPELDPNFKLTPYFESKLEEFTELAHRQLGLTDKVLLQELINNRAVPEWENLSAKGMTVIVGPKGTGKNKLAEYFCGITQRPLFRYACSINKEEPDLTYSIQLQDGDTILIPSRILSAITTPNAVLELDEINLLKPEVSKFFNSLLDGDRALFLNDRVIEVAPGVIIVGLMNPADYDGVEDLPETISDRSNIMTMKYPPFTFIDSSGMERFTYDEAAILRVHIPPLRHLTDEQFISLWDSVINKIGSPTTSVDNTIIRVLKDLKNIISLANKSRKVVEDYKTRAAVGITKMTREISIRGSIAIVQFYAEHRLWENTSYRSDKYNLNDLNAAQYAVLNYFHPQTETFKKGRENRLAMDKIVAETI